MRSRVNLMTHYTDNLLIKKIGNEKVYITQFRGRIMVRQSDLTKFTEKVSRMTDFIKRFADEKRYIAVTKEGITISRRNLYMPKDRFIETLETFGKQEDERVEKLIKYLKRIKEVKGVKHG